MLCASWSGQVLDEEQWAYGRDSRLIWKPGRHLAHTEWDGMVRVGVKGNMFVLGIGSLALTVVEA